MNNNDEHCFNYKLNIKDLLFIPFQTFKDLCQSYDKTYLFIVTFIRFLIILFIFYVFYKNGWATMDKEKYFKIMLFLVFLFLSIANFVSLLIVLFKKT